MVMDGGGRVKHRYSTKKLVGATPMIQYYKIAH